MHTHRSVESDVRRFSTGTEGEGKHRLPARAWSPSLTQARLGFANIEWTNGAYRKGFFVRA